MTIRYGLIGAGMMGQEHIRNIRLLGASVSAIADPDEGMRAASSRLAGEGVSCFSDFRDMVSADLSADSCDAYLIAAPNDLHHELLLGLLPSNKPILCEKPFCSTSRDCLDVIEKANGRTAPIWIAMEYRYMAPIRRLVEERDAGTAGKPVMFSIREHRFPFLEKVGDWNRFNERSGGTMVEKCCHFWDLMRLVLDSDPVRVYASASTEVNHLDERYEGRIPDVLDNGFVVVDFANGTRAMLDLCMFAEGSHWQEVASLTGSEARIDACVPGPSRFAPDGVERHAELIVSRRSDKRVEREIVEVDEAILKAGDHHGSTYFQHERFLELIRSGRGEPEVSMLDGLWSVLVGEAAERSARIGEAIQLKEAAK